jgi:hypothetical protein
VVIMAGWLLFVLLSSLLATRVFRVDSRIALPVSIIIALVLGWPLIALISLVNSCNAETTFPFSFQSRC